MRKHIVAINQMPLENIDVNHTTSYILKKNPKKQVKGRLQISFNPTTIITNYDHIKSHCFSQSPKTTLV